MRRGMAVAALVGVIGFAAAAQVDARPACAEDQSCWNWATMGDHKRGIETTKFRDLVVGPCAYRRIAESGHLAPWNPDLKGDAWALRHGCER